MAVDVCGLETNTDGMELARHGTTAFPIAVYDDDLEKSPVPWHWHEEFEAAVVISGELLLSAGSVRIRLAPGDGFFINSGILHAVDAAGHAADAAGHTAEAADASAAGISHACILHSAVFHPRLIGGSIDSIFWQDYISPLISSKGLPFLHLEKKIPWQKKCLDIVEEAWKEKNFEKKGYEFRIRSLLSDFIYLLSQHHSTAQHPLSGKQTRENDRIKRMLTFIHEHYADDIDTEAIAASITVSPSECLRCFHGTIGTTPIRYLIEYRIEKAAALIGSTEMKISEAAAQCGFQEMSYFAKCFRNAKDMSPSEFREMKQDA